MKSLPSINWFRNPTTWILAALMLTVVIGFVLADDYGPSIDEPHNANLGSHAVTAYLTLGAVSYGIDEFRYHGPFYASLREAVTEIVEVVVPSWVTYDVGHFVYFLSLPIALASLYYIALRWTSPQAALVASPRITPAAKVALSKPDGRILLSAGATSRTPINKAGAKPIIAADRAAEA